MAQKKFLVPYSSHSSRQLVYISKSSFGCYEHTWVFWLRVCLYSTFVPGAHRGQKTIKSPWNWNYTCQLLCGCWESNLGLLAEKPVFLTVEPFLQSEIYSLYLATYGWLRFLAFFNLFELGVWDWLYQKQKQKLGIRVVAVIQLVECLPS